MAHSDEAIKQTGVVPYRKREGKLEVLLITSRTRRRWIIPKGNLEPDLTMREAAAEEAYEEAGVRGAVSTERLGTYEHGIPPGTKRVALFLMEVEEELARWPEDHERQRRWLSLEEASRRFFEDELRQLVVQAGEVIKDRGSRCKP